MTDQQHCEYWQKETILEQSIYELQKYRCARPIPPAPETQLERFNAAMISGHTVSKEVNCGVTFTASQLLEHDAAIAAKTREKILDKWKDWIEENGCAICVGNRNDGLELIKSLRTSKEYD